MRSSSEKRKRQYSSSMVSKHQKKGCKDESITLSDEHCGDIHVDEENRSQAHVSGDSEISSLGIGKGIRFPVENMKECDIQAKYEAVIVDRDFEINKRRIRLPSCMVEQEIVDNIKNNDFVLITGDTGSGKSTQIPQFLYESGFCVGDTIIGITQVRRIACLAISKQISMEMNSKTVVGYQVRYNKGYNAEFCKIKFMTDGILMQELRGDLLCSKYSVIVIDEAHERSLNCDILIGILSRIVNLRRVRYNKGDRTLPPLKLVIMSATLRKEDFLESKIFNKEIAHLHIPSRAQRNSVYYSRINVTDYVLESRNKVLQIHKKLPPGTILVFLTGKDEIYRLKNMLNVCKESLGCERVNKSPNRDEDNSFGTDDTIFNLDSNCHEEDTDTNNDMTYHESKNVNDASDTVYDSNSNSEEDSDYEKYHDIELETLSRCYKKQSDVKWYGSDGSGRLRIIILHASQNIEEQMAAFNLPEDGERVVILTTNVAETSVTLPNIRYVVDCGKEKRRCFLRNGLTKFMICDISKASAEQRAGRAGRLGHGHCYRLYTSAVFETIFDQNSPIEIMECNLESTILFLSSIGIKDPFDFPYLTRPPNENIVSALKSLGILGAIELPIRLDPKKGTPRTMMSTDPFKFSPYHPKICDFDAICDTKKSEITKLGKFLSLIPMEPRFSKMVYCVLSRGTASGYVRLAFCVISALSFTLKTLISRNHRDKEHVANDLPVFKNDVDLLIWICCRYSQHGTDDKRIFCKDYNINEKALREAFLQAIQVYNIIRVRFAANINLANIEWSSPMEMPSSHIRRLIEESIIECLVDKVAIRSALFCNSLPQNPNEHGYKCGEIPMGTKDAYLPYKYSKFKPECVVYSYLVEEDRIRMQDVLQTDTATLTPLKSPLILSCQIQKDPPPRYDESKDATEVYVKRLYAPLRYYLGVSKIILSNDHPLSIRVFAQQFCFGTIFKGITDFKPFFRVKMQDFLEPTKLDSCILDFLLVLVSNKVTNKVTFKMAYRRNKMFMYKEFKQLLRENAFDNDSLLKTFENLI